MPNKDKPEKKPTGQTTMRDYEQEYHDSKLKLNKRVLRKKPHLNNLELDLAYKNKSEEN